jgi:hypothetical protein
MPSGQAMSGQPRTGLHQSRFGSHGVMRVSRHAPGVWSAVLRLRVNRDRIEVSVMTEKSLSLSELQGKARGLRCHIIGMTATAGSGHPGGSLSSAYIVAALHFGVMRHDPHRPHWEDRDRFILSKGHAAPVLYAVLAERGCFPTRAVTSSSARASSCAMAKTPPSSPMGSWSRARCRLRTCRHKKTYRPESWICTPSSPWTWNPSEGRLQTREPSSPLRTTCFAESRPVPLRFVAIRNRHARSGKPNELLETYGLTSQHIASAVREVVKEK